MEIERPKAKVSSNFSFFFVYKTTQIENCYCNKINMSLFTLSEEDEEEDSVAK